MADENASPSPRSHRLPPWLLARARDMRHEPTSAEQKLWYFLRDRRLCGLKFRRQVPFGNYVADFYCASAQLIVELDGDSHDGREGYDEARTGWLSSRSLNVVRFTNDEVHTQLDAVLVKIAQECGVAA